MTVFVNTYEPEPFSKKEILRYAGANGVSDGLDGIIDECIAEVSDRLIYKVCYREFKINITDEGMDLGFIKTNSHDLKKNLRDCRSVILFGATVGIEPDRLVARYSVISPVKALIHQAIGAERIESLCDTFCRDIARGRETVPRFSAGYGDLPIEAQRDIFNALDCQRKIGLTLNESLLMSPSKSVTALIGVKK